MQKYFFKYSKVSEITDAELKRCKNFEITHLIDGEAYFEAVNDEIYKAGRQPGDFIHIAGWAFSELFRLPDQSAERESILKILLDKVRGYGNASLPVDVKILSAFSSTLSRPDSWIHEYQKLPGIVDGKQYPLIRDTLSSIASIMQVPYLDLWRENAEFINTCRAYGIKNAVLDDNTDPIGSHHIKAVIVKNKDGISAFLGGLDLHDDRQDSTSHDSIMDNAEYLNSRKWHDCGVRLRGYPAFEVWEDFHFRWNYCAKNNPKVGKAYFHYMLIPDYIEPIPADEYEKNKKMCENFTEARANSEFYPNTYSNAGASVPAAAVIARSYGKVVTGNYTFLKHSSPHMANDGWVTKTSISGPHILNLETSIIKAINAAEKYIYIEDQDLSGAVQSFDSIKKTSPTIIFTHLLKAAKRGVKVILLTTNRIDKLDAPDSGGSDSVLDTVTYEYLLKPLGFDKQSSECGNVAFFTSMRLYYHTKLIMIDDVFLSIGTANAFDRSLKGIDSELTCLLVAEPGTDPKKPHPVKDLRRHLWMEAMGLQVYSPRKGNAGYGGWPLEGKEEKMWDLLYDPDKALPMWRRSWGINVKFPCEEQGYPVMHVRKFDKDKDEDKDKDKDEDKFMLLPSFLLTNMMQHYH